MTSDSIMGFVDKIYLDYGIIGVVLLIIIAGSFGVFKLFPTIRENFGLVREKRHTEAHAGIGESSLTASVDSTDLGKLVSDLNEKLISDLNEKIDSYEKQEEKRFDKLERRLDRIDERIIKLGDDLAGLRERFAKIDV